LFYVCLLFALRSVEDLLHNRGVAKKRGPYTSTRDRTL
jgi:hypothetical protein